MAEWANAISQGIGAAANTGAALIGDQIKQQQQIDAEQAAANIKLDLSTRMAAAEEMMKNRAAERFSGYVKDAKQGEVPVAPQTVQQSGLTSDGATAAGLTQGGITGGTDKISGILAQAQGTLANPNATDEQKQDAQGVIDQLNKQGTAQQGVNATAVQGKTRQRTMDEAKQAALDNALQNDGPAFIAGTGMLATGMKQDAAERAMQIKSDAIDAKFQASKDRTDIMGQIAQLRADALVAAKAAGTANGTTLPSDAKMIEYLVQHGDTYESARDKVLGTGAGATKDPVAMATSLASSMIAGGSVRVSKDDPPGTTQASKAMTMAMDQISAAESRFRNGGKAAPEPAAAKPASAGNTVANPFSGNDPLGLFK